MQKLVYKKRGTPDVIYTIYHLSSESESAVVCGKNLFGPSSIVVNENVPHPGDEEYTEYDLHDFRVATLQSMLLQKRFEIDDRVIGRMRWCDTDCDVHLDTYVKSGRPALSLTLAGTPEPMAHATVNVPDAPLASHEVLVRNYSENEGILDALVDAGMLTLTGETFQSGYATLDVCRLASSHMALLKS